MFQEDAKQDAVDALYNDILNHQMQLNVEYKSNGMDYVTLLGEDGEASSDVGLSLVSEGYVLVENRKEKRLAKLVSDYMKAQDQAKKERVGLCIFVVSLSFNSCAGYCSVRTFGQSAEKFLGVNLSWD